MDYQIAPAAAAPVSAAASRAVASVLLIEEDEAISAVTAEILADDGYQVDRVAAPSAALALFARQGPHAYGLVLSDAFTRDRAQAYTWFEQLRTVTSARVVIWSAAPPHVYVDYRTHGRAAFLAKPFDLDELLALLTALVPDRP